MSVESLQNILKPVLFVSPQLVRGILDIRMQVLDGLLLNIAQKKKEKSLCNPRL